MSYETRKTEKLLTHTEAGHLAACRSSEGCYS